VRGVAGTGDGQYVRAEVERPGEPDLGGGRAVGTGDGVDLGRVSRAGDREERDVGDAQLTADAQQFVVLCGGAERETVLYADDRRDGPCLRQVFRRDVGNA
jgi:hypothetical protein